MGAWGVETLNNDTALDDMSWIAGADFNSQYFIIRLLLHSIDDQEVTLGAALVITAIRGKSNEVLGNSYYDYEGWLDYFYKTHHKKIDNMASEAWSGLQRIYKPEVIGKWTDTIDRANYLNDLKYELEDIMAEIDAKEK